MANNQQDENNQGIVRYRPMLRSDGHNPPRLVDKPLPTLEQLIFAEGGPGRGGAGEGSLPWILGSIPLGSGDVLNLTFIHMETNTPNVWFKIRHNHSGTAAMDPRGGTMDSFHLAAKGGRSFISDPESPVRSFRGPGTLTFEAFGPRNAVTGAVPHGSLGTRAQDAFVGELKGYIV